MSTEPAPTMSTCPACGWPLGNRSFAPQGGVAPCVRDRYVLEDQAPEVQRVD